MEKETKDLIKGFFIPEPPTNGLLREGAAIPPGWVLILFVFLFACHLISGA